MTPEIKERLRLRRLGKKASPETREKQCQAKLGRKHTPEHNAAISAGARRAWAKKNPIRISSLPPDVRYYVSKLYKNGFDYEEIREALLSNPPNHPIAPEIG